MPCFLKLSRIPSLSRKNGVILLAAISNNVQVRSCVKSCETLPQLEVTYAFKNFSCKNSQFENLNDAHNVDAYVRGIEWSLRALGSMGAARLFLRARGVIKYVLRAATTLKNTDGEQQALRKFSRRNLDFSLLKRSVFCHVIWLTPLNQ